MGSERLHQIVQLAPAVVERGGQANGPRTCAGPEWRAGRGSQSLRLGQSPGSGPVQARESNVGASGGIGRACGAAGKRSHKKCDMGLASYVGLTIDGVPGLARHRGMVASGELEGVDMTGYQKSTTIPGSAYDEVLQELHAHAFTGVPGESDPFTLGILEREYIAYALALYYQCDHCQDHHGAAVARELRRAKVADWPWRSTIEKIVLFTRTEKRWVSAAEWARWEHEWVRFTHVLGNEHALVASHVALAIGIARADKDLITFAWSAVGAAYPDPQRLLGMLRDVIRVVVFMKAATSEFRVTQILKLLLAARGIEV